MVFSKNFTQRFARGKQAGLHGAGGNAGDGRDLSDTKFLAKKQTCGDTLLRRQALERGGDIETIIGAVLGVRLAFAHRLRAFRDPRVAILAAQRIGALASRDRVNPGAKACRVVETVKPAYGAFPNVLHNIFRAWI